MKSNSEEIYVIACSGGPDSMALLDKMRRVKKVVVAHVNYHKRKKANHDERLVMEYCKKHGIPFEKKDVHYRAKSGNFQDWARKKRYRFFKEVADRYQAKAVLVAHHLDDLLETYLLQKKRNSFAQYYGLKKRVTIFDVKVMRPLLHYTKEELCHYCDRHHIAYAIDQSNLEDDYTRNQIRHEIIEHMNKEEKLHLLEEVKECNREQKEKQTKARAFLKKREKLSLEAFLSYEDPLMILRLWLYDDLSLKHLNEILEQIKTSKKDKHIEMEVRDKILVKEYGYVEVFDKKEPYADTYQSLRFFKKKYYHMKKSGDSFSAVTVLKEDFPLTIRSVKDGDAIFMRYGKKRISRFFIDHKIPTKMRKSWPIVTNCKGEIILVPKIGCNVNHYSIKPNLFVVEL